MNWKEYLPLAEKTLSSQFNCDEFYQKILHAIIGNLTEIEELLQNYEDGVLIKDINKQGSVAEESADAFWYISILFRELNINPFNYNFNEMQSKFKGRNPFDILLSFTKINLKFLDLLKKKLFYNKPIDMSIMINLTEEMFILLVHYCYVYNTSVENILDKNIEKLRSRYGDKFSSERAINRNLDTEKSILEG